MTWLIYFAVRIGTLARGNEPLSYLANWDCMDFFLSAGFLGMLCCFLPVRTGCPIRSCRLSIVSYRGNVIDCCGPTCGLPKAPVTNRCSGAPSARGRIWHGLAAATPIAGMPSI